MGFLLDTNVLSELRRPDRMPEGARRKLMALDADARFVSVVSLMEIEEGVLLMERRDPMQGAALRSWLAKLRADTPVDRILPVGIEMVSICAALHVPDRRPYSDALLAATALAHNLTLVTRNVRDFDIAELRVLNPWDA